MVSGFHLQKMQVKVRFPICMNIKKMTRKTILYYGVPLLVICAIIGGCANVLFFTLFDLFINGFRASLIVAQIVSIISAFVLVWLFIRRFVPFCKIFYYRKEIKRFHFDINMSNRCVMWDGAPGTGKTFSSIYLACYQSLLLWEELITQYLIRIPFAAQYLLDYRQGKSNFWTAYKAVWDSVKFYNENGYIPCCYSNVKFVFCGKEPIPLDLKYFQQKKRFAEFNIKLLDEGAELLPNTMRTNNGFKDPLNVNDINNYLSMFRQYDEGHIIFNDQRGKEVFNGARAVFNVTNYLIEQKTIMSPRFLRWLYGFLVGRIKKREVNTSRKLSAFLIWLDELIKDIGFRRFYYVRTLGAEGRMKNDKEIHDYVLPCDVPFTYDDRARRHEYKAKDLSLTI